MRQTLVLDSSQLAQFGECPMKWELSSNERLALNNDIRDDFAMGTYGHKLLEIYYSNIHKGTDAAVNEINNYVLPPDYPLSDERVMSVKNRVRDYWIKYSTVGDIAVSFKECKTFGIGEDGFPFEQKQIEPLVEKGFSYLLLDTPEYLFVLEGKIDLIGTIGGLEVFLDHKFQSRAHTLLPKSIQFRNYALATGFKTGIINYIRLHKNLEKDTLERKIISLSVNEMQQWREELIEMFIRIAKSVKALKYWKERASCAGKYGFPCEFTRICDETELVTIQAIKESLFKKKDEWKPW